MRNRKSYRQKGFTVLLAALVASLVLTLGISIFSIAKKQVILSSLGRSSQFAFYAADTAAECALYWDVRFQLFSSTSIATTPKCSGLELGLDPNVAPATPPYEIEFTLENLFQSSVPGEAYAGNCAKVVVTKSLTNPKTVIRADGFSTTCADISVSGRALQRSVEIRY